ncbi:His Kinase A (phospho-acceptor) domain-containing protein [Devosia sp. YR412]|uniref:sensor histidine kinase n=1 Tax=Devosia sp. YR412 TaxID=1881030 RepID=UPI0008B287C7|nr:ATP-binding protein [Devosia sp. YR412]SEQ01574.1 His Kinase A (phospho-acceptor) domain-containing protein [Devosia sp. YR412]
MPISTNVFVRSTTLLLAVAFLALATIVGTTIWLVENNNYWFNETTNARVARAVTVSVRNALQDAETGQRGYLLTQDERYLEPYDAALPELPGFLDRLEQVLAPYAEANGVADMVRTNTNNKLAELAETVELTRAGRFDEALAIVRGDSGKVDMDALRTMFTGIIDAADARTIEGLEYQRNGTVALRWVTIIGGVIIFAFVGAAAWTVVTYNGEIAAARAEVEAANAGLEERVRERTSDLGRANEEIQRFAYIVTHDLRAPLVNIMGFTSELETSVGELAGYMKDRPDDGNPNFADAKLAATEDLPEAITFIRAATRKMDSLINAILKISREGRRQLKPETLDLAEIANATVTTVQHQIVENGGTATVDVRLPRIVTDKLSLEQVLGNLLDNAIKYQQPGRPLEVTVRARPAQGNRIEIEVEDNGRGIAANDHERVFELFRRAGTQTQPGEGIGLAHVRTMVRSLGGDITLRSELGTGTTFIIILPRDLRSFIGSQSA